MKQCGEGLKGQCGVGAAKCRGLAWSWEGWEVEGMYNEEGIVSLW